MKKITFLLLMFLGFSTLQAQELTSTPTLSTSTDGATKKQMTVSNAGIFASRQTVTTASTRNAATVYFAVTQATENCDSTTGNPAQCGATTTMLSVETNPSTNRAPGAKYYIRSNTNNPWGQVTNEAAMDAAFGAGNWTQAFFETLVMGTVFSPGTNFVFLEGSDGGANELNTFLTTNLAAIEAWVNGGGKLILNAAPNEGSNINFGFGGTTLVYTDFSGNVAAVDPLHPAFVGPLTPTATAMSGTSYGHATISGTGYTNILLDSADSGVVLAEKDWGAGLVIVGGMTTTNWHSPSPQAFNFRANLFNYADDYGGAGCPPFDIAGPYCAPCNDPSGGFALACSLGPNSIIQGIDVSGVPGAVNVNSIDFNQESFGTAPTITVNLFCAPAAGPVPYGAVDTPFYTESFPLVAGDDGSCVTLTLTTPPSIDASCDTMWIEIVTPADTSRAVQTPPTCDGNTATGTNSWIVASACGINTPTSFAAIGFSNNDASYNATFECNLGDPPVITCPADIVLDNAAGQCGAVANYAGTAIDTEDGDISGDIVYTPPSGSFFDVGTTTVTASVTDSDGNTSTCDFDVTVNDVEDPVVVCTDFTAELDATGNVTVFPGDVATATDNCPGVTLEFQGSGGPMGSLTSLFGANNGGSFGGAVYFDVTIAGSDLEINAIDVNTADGSGGSFDIDVYTIPGTSVGNETNGGLWTLVSTGTGTAAGLNNPSNAVLATPFTLSASTSYGIAIVMDGSHGHDYTNGTGGNQNFSNADLSMSLGQASNAPFTPGIFSPRVFNGTLHYGSPAPPVPSLDFTCMDVGPNNVTVIATDAAGNTSTCTAVVTVEDNIAPVIVCIGEPTPVTDSASASPGLPFGGAPTVVTSTIDVTDDFIITDLDVDVDISHTWVGDIIVTLESPSGTVVTIIDRPGDITSPPDGCAGDNIVATLDDEAATPVEDECDAGTPTISGSFIPNNPLSAFDGESTLGTWTMTVEDAFPAFDDGVFNSWAINYTHDVTAAPYDAILDGTTGTVVVDLADLLLSVDEACGYTVTTGGGAPIPGSITSLFGADNGGSAGGAVYFDVTVGPEDISILDIDINTADAGAFTMEVYTLVGTYVGNEGNSGAWTLSANGSGTAMGLDVPSNAVLDAPIVLTAGTTYGMALVLDASHGHDYTNGDGTNQNYSNADVSLSLGAASNAPFDGAPFSPRVFNGTLNYEIGEPASTTIEFDCSQLGLNEVEITVTDDSGNSSTCTATVNVIDNTDPILVCMDATVELDENGMAEVTPDLFIDTANSFDACGITITAVDVTDVTCDDIGTAITVTVFASDASGNLASCTATLTVVDLLGPAIEGCPADQTVDPGPLNLFYELPDYWALGGITAVDNCTDPVTDFSQTPAAGTLLPDGVYTISICATDEYGNEGCCTFELTIESVLGKDDIALDNAIAMYPNPSDGQVTISNTSNIVLEKAVIYDANGRLVQEVDLRGMATERTFNVSSLASGVYMVQIQSEDAQTVKRLIRR